MELKRVDGEEAGCCEDGTLQENECLIGRARPLEVIPITKKSFDSVSSYRDKAYAHKISPKSCVAIMSPTSSNSTVIIIAIASVANALNQGDRAIMPIASILMAEELEWSLLQKGWVLSSFAWGYICAQLPSGYIAARMSPFVLLAWAVFAWSLLTILTPFAARTSLQALFACRIFMGLAEGFCLPSIYQLFALHVPVPMRSRAFGYMYASGAIGQFIVLWTCSSMSSWEHMFLRFGIMGLFFSMVCLCFMLQGRTALVGLESKVSLDEPRGGYTLAGEEKVQDAQDAVSASSRDAAVWGRMLRCRPVLGICVAHFVQNWTLYMLASWMPTYLHEVLRLPKRSLWLSAVPFLVMGITGVVVGYLSDAVVERRSLELISVRRLATGVGLIGSALCLGLFAMSSSAMLAVGFITCAYFFAAINSCGHAANHADISAKHAGLTFGLSNTLATIPGLTAGPLTAWLIVATGSWTVVFTLASCLSLVGAITYVSLAKAHRVL